MESIPHQESAEEKIARLEAKVASLERENEELKKEKEESLKELDNFHRGYTVTAIQNQELEIEKHELEGKAYFDELTGLKNRRAFAESLKTIFRTKRENGPERRTKEGQEDNVCVLMIDIDHFKLVNDTYGHDAGDKVLKEVSKRLEGSIRGNDVIARYGGEEIIILLVATSEDGAKDKADKLREVIANEKFDVGNDKSINVTVSVGVAFGDKDSDPEEMKKQADEAVYDSKHNGRNKVTVYNPESK